MKKLVRTFLINFGALYVTTQVFPSLEISGGVLGLLIGAIAFMVANILLVPLIKVLLLPLNLLTLGLFAWLSNVLALYFLANVVPYFKVYPYTFPGYYYQGFVIPTLEINAFQTVIVVSFVIGFIIHFINWLLN